MSKLRLHGTSSGYTDIAPTAAAGNNTLTAPTGTGTLVAEDSSGNISISEGLVHTGDTNTKIKFPAADTITAETGGSERLRITSDGDVVIGAASATTVTGAATPFQVSGSDGYTGISLIRTASAGAQFQFAAGSSGDNVSDNDGLGYFKFYGYHTNGYDEYARIHAEVDGSNGDGDAPGALVFATTADTASSPTERLRITSTGSVGIGLANPDDYYAEDLVVKCSAAEGGITIRSNAATDTDYVMFADGTDGTERYRGYLGYHHNTGTSGGEHMQIAAAGNAVMRIYSDGVSFDASTAAANRLDDYEEGTWTTSQLGSGGGVPLSNAVANYTKIGNIVHVQGMIDVGASSGSSSVEFSLPFTSKADSGTAKARNTFALMHKHCNINDSYKNIVGYVGQNENYWRIYNVGDNMDWHQFISGDFSANSSEILFSLTYKVA